jgi:hypothetical protein
VTDEQPNTQEIVRKIAKPGKKASNPVQPVTNYITSTKANRTVLLCVGGAVTVVLFARISGTPGTKGLNDPGDLIKIAVGTGATLIALMAIAEVSPEIATHLAYLIVVGAMLSYGVDFATALSKGTLKPGIPLTPLVGQKAGK